MLNEYITIDKAKEFFDISEGQLQSEIAKGNLDLVFSFSGGLARNKSINTVFANYPEDPFSLVNYDMGNTGEDEKAEHTGHISYRATAWLVCRNLDALFQGQCFEFTAKIYEVISGENFKNGDIVGMFSFISSEYNNVGIFPISINYEGCGLVIKKDMLHVPFTQLQRLSNQSKIAIDCKDTYELKPNKKDINDKDVKYKLYLKDNRDSLIIIGSLLMYLKDKTSFKTKSKITNDLDLFLKEIYLGASVSPASSVLANASAVYEDKIKKKKPDTEGTPSVILGCLLILISMTLDKIELNIEGKKETLTLNAVRKQFEEGKVNKESHIKMIDKLRSDLDRQALIEYLEQDKKISGLLSTDKIHSIFENSFKELRLKEKF